MYIFREKIGQEEVTVAVTPNGYADAITEGKFVMPEQRVMTVGQFLDVMKSPESRNGIFYIQKQNSNLTDEFLSVMEDVEGEIEWGSEAFGKFGRVGRKYRSEKIRVQLYGSINVLTGLLLAF